MCQGMDYCFSCQPTAEMEEWTQGRKHIMPTPGDSAQRVAMTLRREIAFKKALRQGTAQAWPEYGDPSRSFDKIFTPEEQRFISGETDMLTTSQLPFAQRARLRFVLDQRVNTALRKFRKGDTTITLWREYQFARTGLAPTAKAEVQRIFSLLEGLALARLTTGLAARKHVIRARRYKKRVLRLLGRAASKGFLVSAWLEHFAFFSGLSEQQAPKNPLAA